ncbi:MAG: hypothetical protein QM496_18540 [Verrucomicrobiota bacterium]
MKIKRRMWAWVLAGVLCGMGVGLSAAETELELAVFEVDVTPEVGDALCYGLVKPMTEVVDPLTARGVVLLGAGEPVVLCVVDFVGIANGSSDQWREAIAKAAGTTRDRVAVHTIHNHDSPGCDASAAKLLDGQGLKNVIFDQSSHDLAIAKTVVALKDALAKKQRITHVGSGKGMVEKFASNRRILGEDGKIKWWRGSSCKKPEVAAAAEGTIDPELSLLSFWNGEQAVAALTFYASHPMSYYGKGGVTPDTSGLARRLRQQETGVTHIHFNGAGGNVAAGKYNDGSVGNRAVLTARMEAGMKRAWESQQKVKLDLAGVKWNTVPVSLPWKGKTEDELNEELLDEKTPLGTRIRAARDLVYFRRWKEGHKIDIGRLAVGPAQALFFPGELFVEYQLQAKKMKPEQMVAVAAYGDGGPGYIGTQIAYGQGGYEVGRVSRTQPEVEGVLMQAVKELLQKN